MRHLTLAGSSLLFADKPANKLRKLSFLDGTLKQQATYSFPPNIRYLVFAFHPQHELITAFDRLPFGTQPKFTVGQMKNGDYEYRSVSWPLTDCTPGAIAALNNHFIIATISNADRTHLCSHSMVLFNPVTDQISPAFDGQKPKALAFSPMLTTLENEAVLTESILYHYCYLSKGIESVNTPLICPRKSKVFGPGPNNQLVALFETNTLTQVCRLSPDGELHQIGAWKKVPWTEAKDIAVMPENQIVVLAEDQNIYWVSSGTSEWTTWIPEVISK